MIYTYVLDDIYWLGQGLKFESWCRFTNGVAQVCRDPVEADSQNKICEYATQHAEAGPE